MEGKITYLPLSAPGATVTVTCPNLTWTKGHLEMFQVIIL